MWVSVRERYIKLLLGTVTCISAAETSNCIIATETVTYIIATERSTYITVTESNACITAIEPQEFVHVLFCVFQTNLNKAANIFCTLPEMIRNIQMILPWLTQKTEEMKSNKGNFIFSHT